MVVRYSQVQKIKADLSEILRENSGRCLCGHGEWCEECSTFSAKNKLTKAIEDYLNKLKDEA